MDNIVANLLKNDPELRAMAAGKQMVYQEFFDTKTVLAAGLGAVGAPAPQQWFDGQTAANATLTNIFRAQGQMGIKEVAIITGISVTPLAITKVIEGATAAAVNAIDIARDVDTFIKRSAIQFSLGNTQYPIYPVQSVGGNGGLSGAGSIGSTVATSLEVRSFPGNGEQKVGAYLDFRAYPIIWYGSNFLSVTITGATGALSADLPVRVGIHCRPYFRNVRQETQG